MSIRVLLGSGVESKQESNWVGSLRLRDVEERDEMQGITKRDEEDGRSYVICNSRQHINYLYPCLIWLIQFLKSNLRRHYIVYGPRSLTIQG